jgi:arginyl-tRNA synthetase
MQELKDAIKAAAKQLFDADIEPELSRPDERFGDYATNAALQLAKRAAKAPNEIAQKLVAGLQSTPGIKQVSVAGPGFINFKLTDEALTKSAMSATDLPKPNQGQEVLAEFGDPNPFKEMHIGHLYSYIVGDSISRLLEAEGATVRRLSYHGDVGLHVAKAIYGLSQLKSPSDESMATEELEELIKLAYAYGAKQYEDDAAAKSEIESINLHVYQQDDPEINKSLKDGSKLSFNYFDKILSLLSINTDKRYLESQTAGPGRELVEQNIGQIFTKSQGAIVYEGQKA